MLRQLSSYHGRPRHLILVRELSRLRLSDDLTTHVVCLPRACPVPDGAANEWMMIGDNTATNASDKAVATSSDGEHWTLQNVTDSTGEPI